MQFASLRLFAQLAKCAATSDNSLGLALVSELCFFRSRLGSGSVLRLGLGLGLEVRVRFRSDRPNCKLHTPILQIVYIDNNHFVISVV